MQREILNFVVYIACAQCMVLVDTCTCWGTRPWPLSQPKYRGDLSRRSSPSSYLELSHKWIWVKGKEAVTCLSLDPARLMSLSTIKIKSLSLPWWPHLFHQGLVGHMIITPLANAMSMTIPSQVIGRSNSSNHFRQQSTPEPKLRSRSQKITVESCL